MMRADADANDADRASRIERGLAREAEEANQQGEDNVAPQFLDSVSAATLGDSATLESRVRTKRHTQQRGSALDSEAFMSRGS